MSTGVHRGYSLLHIKALDDDRRELSGFATTPEPDRVGDSVDPHGVKFKNPLPLLLHHDSTRPVGTVRFEKPTDEGIRFTARIPEIKESGTLRDRVDEAWQSVKARLISGVSIGYRILKDGAEFNPKTGGFFLTGIDVVELSLVTVPANAHARIDTIKQLDVGCPAATGDGHEHVTRESPGVTGSSRRKTTMPPTVSDRITELEASRREKSARMKELMDPVIEKDADLDTDHQAEYDELAKDVKAIDVQVERFRALEDAMAAKTRPVQAEGFAAGSASRDLGIKRVQVKDTLPPGVEFARAAICLMASRGNYFGAAELAKHQYPDHPRIAAWLMKAAVPGGTTTHETWAKPLVEAETLTSEFIEFLRPMTILGRFGVGGVPSLRRVPFNVRITGQTSGGTGYWVGEGAGKPLTKFDFTAVTLPFKKVAAISVISDELARFSSPSAETLVRDGLASALVERMDLDFIDPSVSVSSSRPASITNGIAATVHSGTDAAAVRGAVQSLFGAFIAANNPPTSGVWIMPHTVALSLQLMVNALGQREFPEVSMSGGTFYGMPVITSQYAAFSSPADNVVILLNASDIFLSDDGSVSISASGEASLQMDDNPSSQSSGSPPAASQVVSMYQTNSIALRAERMVNWQRRRDSAVAYLEDVAWSPVSEGG